MLSKTDFKKKALRLYKKTLAGPGKFGVFIILCILIIFSFESLGLSNKESNLEIRTINKRVIPVINQESKAKPAHSSNKSSSTLVTKKLKKFNDIDHKNKISEMEKILYKGAIDQQNYQDKLLIEKIESINKPEFIIIQDNLLIGNHKIIFFDI